MPDAFLAFAFPAILPFDVPIPFYVGVFLAASSTKQNKPCVPCECGRERRRCELKLAKIRTDVPAGFSIQCNDAKAIPWLDSHVLPFPCPPPRQHLPKRVATPWLDVCTWWWYCIVVSSSITSLVCQEVCLMMIRYRLLWYKFGSSQPQTTTNNDDDLLTTEL